MLTKGFLRNTKTINTNKRKSLFVLNAIFYLGVSLSAVCLGYMIVNIENADKIISIWLPFMIAGSIMIALSQILKSTYQNKGTVQRRIF